MNCYKFHGENQIAYNWAYYVSFVGMIAGVLHNSGHGIVANFPNDKSLSFFIIL